MPREPGPLRAVAAVLLVAVTSFSLLQTLVIPVLHTIQQHLGTSQGAVTWVLTAYLLAASVATPILGRLGDMFGKRRMLLVCIGALAVGSVIAAVADSLAVLIGARVLQGVGGGVLPLAFGMIRDSFPARRVAPLIGLSSAMTAAGAGAAIVLAGPIVEHLGYRWLFWIPAIVMSAVFVTAWFVVPESPVRSPGQVNATAALLLSAWLLCLLLPVSRGSAWGWTSPRVVLLGLAAAAGCAGWVLVESRSREPLIDLQLMGIRPVWTTNAVMFLLGAVQFGTFAFIPLFAQTPPEVAGYGFGATVSRSATFLLPSVGMGVVTGLLAGRLTRAFGAKGLLVGGMAVSVTGIVLLAGWHDAEWQLYLSSLLFGGGNGVAFSALAALVVAGVPAHQTGVAAGMNANIRNIGGATGVAVITSILTAQAGAGGFPDERGYTAAFALLAAFLVVGVCFAVLVPGSLPGMVRDRREREQEHLELAYVAGATPVDPLEEEPPRG